MPPSANCAYLLQQRDTDYSGALADTNDVIIDSYDNKFCLCHVSYNLFDPFRLITVT